MLDTIILHPKQDIHAQAYSDKNIVHKREMDQVLDIIRKMKELNSDYDPNMQSPKIIHVHNTITLSGGRGSGKTSFLQTLIARLETEDEDIEILDIVDPTLIEEKGHIFLNIVARIKDRVVEQSGIENRTYKEWEFALNSLAAGLPMLDGINGGLDPSDWNDTTFVMHDGLRRVSGANNLERNFHRYVSLSLKLLSKKFLLIAFDDVDTDFAKGWPVLETLRKYFTSPHILTFLSGDMNLYSVLVRKRQWKNFGKSLLKNEYDKSADRESETDDYMSLVQSLEGQYVLKLLKPEYRITLSTLASKLATGSIDIKVESDDQLDLLDFYKRSLKSLWKIPGNNTNTQSVYLRFLTSLPLRTQLSLLNVFAQFKNETPRHDLVSNVANIFYSELRCADVDVWELLNGSGLINIYLLRFLLDNNVLDEASQFFPKLNNPSLDGAIVALGAILSERLSKDPFELFDHIIRISRIVSKATRWSIRSLSPQEENIMDFVQHSRSLFDYGLQKIASMQNAYILSFEKNTSKDNELIPIKAMTASTKKEKDESDPTLDDVFKGCELEDFLGFLPAFGIQDQLGRTNNFYSIFNLWGAIGDIIQHSSIDEMENEFIRMAQLREYPVFSNKNSFTESESNIKEDHRNLETFKPEKITKFITQLYSWKKAYEKILLPPYLFGRIMVRTSYSFTRIDPTHEWKIADMLHKQLIVFLNAILVEEVMENHGNGKLILTNPTKSDDIFIKNYLRNINSTHPLFDFIFACPLIQSYLDPRLFEQINCFPPEISVYEQLRLINIKGLSRIFRQMKINRTIQPGNNDHIDALINNFRSRGIEKGALNAMIIKKTIKETFANKIVTNAVLEKTWTKLKESTKW